MVNIKPIDTLKGVRITRNEWGLISNLNHGSTYILGGGVSGLSGSKIALYSGVGGNVIVDDLRHVGLGLVLYEDEKNTAIFDGGALNGKAVSIIGTGGGGMNYVVINRAIQLYVTVDGVINYDLNPLGDIANYRLFDIVIGKDMYHSDLSYRVREGTRYSGNSLDSKVIETGYKYDEESFNITIKLNPGFGYVPKTAVYQIGPGVNHIVFDMKLANYTLSSADLPIRINKMKASNT